MRSSAIFVRVAVATFLSTASAFAQSTFKLSGTVSDTAGKPVTNARVQIRYGNNQEPDAITNSDANGAFELTVNSGNLNFGVVPPAGSGLLNDFVSFRVSRDLVARVKLFPPVQIDVTGRVAGSFTERVSLYSLTSDRSYDQFTNDGHATFTVPPDVYSAHVAHADTSYFFGRQTIDARDGNAKSVTIDAVRDAPISSTLPPRRALIHIGTPDANGTATITGDAGACEPLATIVVINLHTHETAFTLSANDGSFSLSMFAPPGSTLQIKHDPSGRYLPNMNLSGGTNEGFEAPPGTYIDVSPTPGQFSLSGYLYALTNDSDLHLHTYQILGSNEAGRWWLSGAMPSQSWTAGQTISLTGKLKIFSRAITSTTPSTLAPRALMNLERVFDADGVQRRTNMDFASTFMTPTGFPIERQGLSVNLGPTTLTNVTVVDGHIEADWSASLKLASSLPPGIYRPTLTLNVTGLDPGQHYFDVLPTPEGEYLGNLSAFPLVRVGSPKPPHLFWVLGLDTFTNGNRGTIAIEDRDTGGITSHVTMSPRTLVLPKDDPRSGTPLRYSLEPYAPLITSDPSRIGYPTRVPLKFPSGSLSIRITRPDGTVDDLGNAPFAQSMSHSATTRSGPGISRATSHVTDFMQLTTLEPRFNYMFTQWGQHRIEMKGTVDDVFGNTYAGGGTYEVWVARPIDIETATFAGTPFESGNEFAPQLVLQPPFPADVSIAITHMPDSDPAKARRWTIDGRANRFGFFSPSDLVRLEGAGEYRVDVTAKYTDASGIVWFGTLAWGSIVETPGSSLVTHGRRGFDGTNTIQQQWFNVRQARTGGDHVMFPFHRGDIMWMQQNDPAADIPKITVQDPVGTFAQRVRERQRIGAPSEGPSLEERISAGEIPLFSTASSSELNAFVPEKATQFGYFYGFAEKPGVHIREVITEDVSGNAYWRFGENYHFQLGAGISGDLPNDFKFQFGGAVWRDPDFKYYGAYASLFVLLPFDDATGGRVFPPFQGNTGDPSGGPIMTLKGKATDLFFHPTATRAGSILQLGERAVFAGQIGPTLPAKVKMLITSPSGVTRTIQGTANKIGYFYDPGQDFVVDEPGVWKAKIGVLFDGKIGSGSQVQAPFPTGDVLGSRDGEFYFYVVRGDAPPPSIAPLPQWQRPSQRPITFELTPPVPLSNVTMTTTTTMPTCILEERTSSVLSYTYDAQALHRDFPNLDLYDQDGIAGSDTITMSFLISGTDASGQRRHFARQIVLQGEELQMPDERETPYQPRRRVLAK